MRCEPVRPDPMPAPRRVSGPSARHRASDPAGTRLRRVAALAALAAAATLTISCVRPAADPISTDAGLSASADQDAGSSGGQDSGGGQDAGGGQAPGGPIGQSGGGTGAPGAPVGPGARPPAGGAAPAPKPGGGNQAIGSPVKIPSFTQIGNPYGVSLKTSIEAALDAACQEAGHAANCVDIALSATGADNRPCIFGGFLPADAKTVEPGGTVTIKVSPGQPCPAADIGDGLEPGTDGTGGDGTGGGTENGSGGTSGGGTDDGSPSGGTGNGTTGGSEGETGGGQPEGSGTAGGGTGQSGETSGGSTGGSSEPAPDPSGAGTTETHPSQPAR